MTNGVTVQSQAPGTAHADLGFWLQSQVIGRPMAMHESHLDSLIEQLVANRFSLPRNRNTGARHTEKGTAILEVHGLLINRYPVLGSFWGLNSYEGLAEQFRRLATNSDVKRVLIDLYSPGGVVLGIRGCSEALEELAAKKPVHAIAHDYAFSAAYWLGCVAQELSIVPGGQVGSIGVRAAHVSYAELLERDGIQVRAFTAGAAKADGAPFKLLTDGEAAERQYEIDREYERFVAHVAKHRPMNEQQVRDTDARCFADDDAVAAGLADRVETLEEMVARIEKNAVGVKPKRKPKTEPRSKGGLAPAQRNPVPPAPDDEPAVGKFNRRGDRTVSEANNPGAGRPDYEAVIAAFTAGMNANAGKPTVAVDGTGSQQQQQPAPAAPAQAPAATDEKARIKSILACEEAKALPGLAQHIAMETDLAPEMAQTILKAAAAEAKAGGDKNELGNALERRMQQPGSSAGVRPDAGARATQRKSLADTVSARYGKKS